MSSIQTPLEFSYEDLGAVRVIKDKNNDEPLFCLKDICKFLNIIDPSDLIHSLKREFDKGADKIRPLKTNGGVQKLVFVTEPELYFILMRSNKKEAKPFRQWVINEVLPSIRKSGSYNMSQEKQEAKQEVAQDVLNLVYKTPCRDVVLAQVRALEERENAKATKVVSYKVVETFQNGKIVETKLVVETLFQHKPSIPNNSKKYLIQ